MPLRYTHSRLSLAPAGNGSLPAFSRISRAASAASARAPCWATCLAAPASLASAPARLRTERIEVDRVSPLARAAASPLSRASVSTRSTASRPAVPTP